MPILRALLAALPFLIACEITPNFVESNDIDDAFARGKYKTVCKGLEMKKEDTRRYATEKLKSIDDPISAECVCTWISAPNNERHDWDAAIAEGLKGTDRDDLAGCFTELVANPALRKRTEAVTALANLPARVARDTLIAVAAEAETDSETRVRALGSVAGDVKYTEAFLTLLRSDPDPAIRTAAADALAGNKDDAVLTEMRRVAAEDADGAVRGAALIALKKGGAEGIDELLCTAMMKDDSPEVRRRAIGAYRGTKRAEAIACLRKRALAVEEDSGVRSQLLAVLKSSPSDDAAKVLCDAIPFWMRNYVKEALPEKIPGTNIVRTQNDRDWDNSYKCLQNAYRRSAGYSCYARHHVGGWFRRVGGTAHVPRCPGLPVAE